MKTLFPGRRITRCIVNNRAYLLCTEIAKTHLNNHICQHCGMKTSTVTPSFCYVFNIYLSCNINIPSFIGNLWWVLLLGNHLNFCKDHRDKIEVPDPLAVEDLISSKLNNKRKLARLITQYRDIFFPIFRKARPSFFRMLQKKD